MDAAIYNEPWKIEVGEMISQARAQGLWLWCRYQDLWFSPDHLEAMHRDGRFMWGSVNWHLPDDAINPVETDWQRTLANELGNNFLMDSAKGKTAYACGIAYALSRLLGKCSQVEWDRLRDEASAFCDAYMTQSS